MPERRHARWLTSLLTFTACLAPVSIARAQALPPLAVSRIDGATTPPSLGPLHATQLHDAPQAALDGAATVSLSISRPMPLGDMLRLLVAGTPLSLVMGDGVDGFFEGDLKGLTLRQALEAVLFPRSLDYAVEGTLLRVHPRRTETRLFDLDYLNVRRAGQGRLRGAESDAEAADDLERGVGALLSSGGRLHVDRHAGLVQVTDFRDRLEQVALYLEAVQLRASRQVRLEARVFEVVLNDPDRPAIDWQAAIARTGGGARMDPAASAIRVGDVDALMRALGEQGQVRTIAAPQVVAMNNEPAIVRVGREQIAVVAPSRVDGDGGERGFTPAGVFDGLTLIVTAQIASDGIVRLNVAPAWAEKTGEARSPRGDTAPVLSVVEADTNVRVRDGDTVVISGLLRERTTTRPGAGFAGFFGAQARETRQSDLVILLTPTVVAPSVPPAAGAR